jgi:ribosomal protein S14
MDYRVKYGGEIFNIPSTTETEAVKVMTIIFNGLKLKIRALIPDYCLVFIVNPPDLKATMDKIISSDGKKVIFVVSSDVEYVYNSFTHAGCWVHGCCSPDRAMSDKPLRFDIDLLTVQITRTQFPQYVYSYCSLCYAHTNSPVTRKGVALCRKCFKKL